jgi:hypothetical protein
MNLYHTSSFGLPVAHPVGILPEALAFQTDPIVFVEPGMIVVAVAHSLLDVTHTLNLQLFEPEVGVAVV